MNNEAYMVPNPVTPCRPIRINPELCVSCYRCADQCRVDIMVRNSVKAGGRAQCEASCPAGEDIRWTTYYIEKGQYENALESIMIENPFPGICGRVCFHPCEEKCARIGLDEGVATNALERAVFDYATPEKVKKPEKRSATGKKVAIIGAGPAGLTCAYYLTLLGHKVTVYEAQPVAGGIPRLHIPEYRLPASVVEKEVKQIVSLGVEIKVNSPVDSHTFQQLKKNYDACFIASGGPVSQKLGVSGENLPGVIPALEFLHKARIGSGAKVGRRVVIIGGGNVATDSARLARRLGAEQVDMVCLESRDIMPAYKTEVEAAEIEGINIIPGWGVKAIHSQGTQVTGIELKLCTSVYDREGRFSPTYDESQTRNIDADTVIAAIGQTTDLSFADKEMKEGTRMKADPITLATPVAGVFTGGDVYAATDRSIAHAVASGKRAAISIDIFLTGGDKKKLNEVDKGAVSMRSYFKDGHAAPENRVPEELAAVYFGQGSRQEPSMMAKEQRLCSMNEVNQGFSSEKSISEARRCFRCSQYLPPIVLFPDECWFCGTCVEECPVEGAIRMEHPLNQKVGWKRKETGELFRLGMKNPPPPYTKPAIE